MSRWICPRCLHRDAAPPPGPDRCPSCGSARPGAGWGWIHAPGAVIDRRYRVEKLLSVGSAGPTYLAREIGDDDAHLGPRLAVKTLFPSQAEGPYLRRLTGEAAILQQLAHRHIVVLRGFVHRAGHVPYLVTRYEAGGSLADHVARVGPLSETVALGIATQIAWALAVVHRHRLVHLDLKPANVLIEAEVEADEVPHCRLADFGLAGIRAQGAGTPEFASPEQFSPHPVSTSADVFALGALLWWMIEGQPFVSLTDRTNPTRSLDDWVTALAKRVSGRHSEEVERWFDQTLVLTPTHRSPVTALVDEGDATLVGASDLDAPPEPPASLPFGLALGTTIDGGASFVDPESVDDPDEHATEINIAWHPGVLGSGTSSGVRSGPVMASGSGGVFTSYSGAFPAASGPRTLSGIHTVHEPVPVMRSHSGLHPAPSPARSVFTAAALVVLGVLVAAAGLLAGYFAMSTWGGG